MPRSSEVGQGRSFSRLKRQSIETIDDSAEDDLDFEEVVVPSIVSPSNGKKRFRDNDDTASSVAEANNKSLSEASSQESSQPTQSQLHVLEGKRRLCKQNSTTFMERTENVDVDASSDISFEDDTRSPEVKASPSPSKVNRHVKFDHPELLVQLLKKLMVDDDHNRLEKILVHSKKYCCNNNSLPVSSVLRDAAEIGIINRIRIFFSLSRFTINICIYIFVLFRFSHYVQEHMSVFCPSYSCQEE